MRGCYHPGPNPMFRLEKLEIHGFKSFYDPANLSFPAAMTAVVGPNGCGKSNICDAIIWVLGENRAAHIRGETMDDVIFQGSPRCRPLSMGEVTLTLGTSNGDAGHPMADDGRIVINRRVFRTGESEFRLNGRRVRLKDISDILMDTGLGIRNYSVMEQGKIDLILSNKPQDRRRLIEAAAGITKYKTKRRQPETNLADLLTRLENARTQVGGIEAEAAEQQTLLDEKTQQLDAARAERNHLRDVADQLEHDRQERSDAVRQHEKSLAEARESLMRTIAKISEARNQVHQIEIAVEKCEFYLSKLSDQARRASENRAGAFATVHDWDGRVTDAQNAVDAAVIHARETLALRDELSARRDALRESLASARDTISQTTYKIGSLRTLLTSLESQDEDVRRAILELIPNAVSAAQSVSATQGFEAALDTLLREVSKAVVVDDGETALEAIRRLRERGAGRGAFINLEYKPAGEGTRRGDAAYSVVGEGEIADAVRHAIPEAYIVGNLRGAMERAKERPSATFITLDGDVVRGPLVVGGRTEGATPGVFSLKRELSDLESHLGSVQSRVSGIAVELQALEDELRGADDSRIIAEERARSAEQELRERRSQREHAMAELERFEKDLAVASEEATLYA